MRNSSEQHLSCDNRCIQITTAELYHDEPSNFSPMAVSSVLVPLDSTINQTLCNIENFVMNNVKIPKYKPLRLKEAMCISMCPSGVNMSVSMTTAHTFIDLWATLGKGFYSMGFTPPMSTSAVVPHRDRETLSFSFHVVKISL